MARAELALAVARSDVPVPPPEGIVRVPLTGYVLVAPLAGSVLGPFASVALWLVPPWSDLPPAIRSAYGPPSMLLGMVLGALIAFGIAWVRTRGRAIAFDARSVWIEGPGRTPEPLPWAGMRRRGGRGPELIAADGRTLAFPREGLANGLDASYLTAWVDGLPESPPVSRVPRAILPALTILGFVLLTIALTRFPPPTIDGDGPYWSDQRIGSVASLAIGFPLMLGAGMAWSLRYAESAGRTGAKETAPRPGDEIAAWFRAHRLRPPALTLREGETYGYREPEFWRTGVKSRRGVRILSLLLGLFLFTVSFASALTTRDDGHGSDATLMALGTLSLAVMGGLALFAPRVTRGGWTIRVMGDRAMILSDRGGELSMPWPPARTHEATRFCDWTDELRDGRRRIRLDRRLLIPVGDAASPL